MEDDPNIDGIVPNKGQNTLAPFDMDNHIKYPYLMHDSEISIYISPND